MFGSPRQAIAYMVACQHGPSWARPRYDNTPRSTGRSRWDHILISTLLYSPPDKGGCGVERDSALDRELRTWATTKGHPRSHEVRGVEIRLRRLLRANGLQPLRRRARVARLVFLGFDPHTKTTREHDHLVEAHGSCEQ